MSYVVVIPARYGSSRLPGKPLADIAGEPMVVRVLQRCQRSSAARVLVATDDDRVAAAVQHVGGEVVMTRADHPSGTDRLQEVAAQLGLKDDDIIVNVQGDEPLIPAEVIEQVAANLASNPDCGIATLCEPIVTKVDLFNPNIVKAVFDNNGIALYFSRAPIPWHRDAFAQQSDEMPEGNWWRHIGIYAYRVGFLRQYVQWPPALLETTEALEQLRAMANGVRIHIAPACADVPGGVDTQADLDRVCAAFSAKNSEGHTR
jgi:3-deoxy-manno-octulosonate cytidylyltransferase (CMP-KDO synthetase)